MNKKENSIKKGAVKTIGKSLIKIADFYSFWPCDGPWYEVKVPKKLQKQLITADCGGYFL